MKERPILFSAPMVRAILEGRKTVTRRVVKPQPPAGHNFSGFTVCSTERADEGKAVWCAGDVRGALLHDPHRVRCPYGQPGDQLWVREAWRVPISLDDLSGKQIAEKCLAAGYRTPWCPIQYEADGARTSEKDWREFGPYPSTQQPGRYRHARFMPRWASRITLEVTGVRVERLKDINEESAVAEGVESLDSRAHEERDGNDFDSSLCQLCGGLRLYTAFSGQGGALPDTDCRECDTHAQRFRALWQSIHGIDSWNANPWVWVVEFKRVTQAYAEATAA